MKDVTAAVERYRELILQAERQIWSTPETGYREVKTSAYMAEKFREMGYTLTEAKDIPGFYTVADTGRPGPRVLVLAEMDSVLCPTHPEADPNTGAVHACGHHAQCAAMLGIAGALRDPAVLGKLCGKIQLCAVPAEELLEIEYRTELKRQGVIRYFGGKSEFLHRGYFDGVDLALMVHTSGRFYINAGSNGCITKRITYKGKAAHAGAAPHLGNNALYAATCGMNAVNAIRETFVDENHIRFHPIVTHGGDIVNGIPATVRMESYVRGRTFDAILDANKRVNRALIGAALSLGTNVEIEDAPGYSPEVNDPGMIRLARDAAALALPEQTLNVAESVFGRGSTDMGDLSGIMPTVQPYAGGAGGTGHGSDFYITDPVTACVQSAKWQLAMLLLLLENNAARARGILADFTPKFASKEEFLRFQDSLNRQGDRIVYREDGVAEALLV